MREISESIIPKEEKDVTRISVTFLINSPQARIATITNLKVILDVAMNRS